MDEFEQTEEAPEPQDEYSEWLAGLTPAEQREAESDPPAEKLPRTLEAATNRLKKLQERGMHVSPEEARERAQLQEMTPLMAARIAENERAEGFYGLDDETVAAQAIDAEAGALQARREFKAAEAAWRGAQETLATPMERRVIEAQAKQAEQAMLEAYETAIGTRAEAGRREHIAAHGDLDPRVPVGKQLERRLLQNVRTMVSPQETPDAALTPDGRVEQLRGTTTEVLEGVSKQLAGEVTTDGRQDATG